MRNFLVALLAVIVLSWTAWKGYAAWEQYRVDKQHIAEQDRVNQERIANERRAREANEELIALRSEIRNKWGMEPRQVLNELSASFGNQPPCPDGWNAQCAVIWRRHAEELFESYNFQTSNVNESYNFQTSNVNARIAAPMPCRKQVSLTLKSWPATELTDPVLTFSRALKKNGATRKSWVALALDPETLEAAFQIGVHEGAVQQVELDGLRRAAIVQLFKARAKTLIVMHNQAAPAHLDAYHQPVLISMRHGSGRLVGMSLSLERGLEWLKPAVLMLEDPTCDVDVSYVAQVPVLFEECSTGLFGTDCKTVYDPLEFTFEGEGELLNLLGAALQPHAPPFGAPPPPSSVSARDIIGAIGFALRVVSLVRGGVGILSPRR